MKKELYRQIVLDRIENGLSVSIHLSVAPSYQFAVIRDLYKNGVIDRTFNDQFDIVTFEAK